MIQKTAETEGPPLLASEQVDFAFQMHLDQTIIFLNYSIPKSSGALEKHLFQNDTAFPAEVSQ